MKSVACSLCLLASLASLAAAASSPAHSLQKRQTTVTNAVIPEIMPRTIDGLSLGTVAVVVAVLIALDIIGTLVLAGAVGAGGRSKAASSRWDWDLAGSAARVYNSIDIVETGLSFAGVEDEACRLRTICEVEQAAANNPLTRLAINTINSNLSGLSRYQTAVEAGLGGKDCSLLYSQCPLSYARAFTSFL